MGVKLTSHLPREPVPPHPHHHHFHRRRRNDHDIHSNHDHDAGKPPGRELTSCLPRESVVHPTLPLVTLSPFPALSPAEPPSEPLHPAPTQLPPLLHRFHLNPLNEGPSSSPHPALSLSHCPAPQTPAPILTLRAPPSKKTNLHEPRSKRSF